jgi:hypothetical protein
VINTSDGSRYRFVDTVRVLPPRQQRGGIPLTTGTSRDKPLLVKDRTPCPGLENLLVGSPFAILERP